MNLSLFLSYGERVTPGFILAAVILFFLPKRFTEFRIVIYIGLFILLRDAMTPLGFWKFGDNGFFWIRFFNEPWILIFMGCFTGVLVFAMNYVDPDLKALVVWKKSSWTSLIIAGLFGAFTIALPSALLYLKVPLEQRGGAVAAQLLFPLFLFSMIGNLYEEILFRGYLQGYLEKTFTPVKAAIFSGLAFAFGHIFLASTVTNVGIMVLVFTLYEGLITSFLRMRFGLIASTIAHGGGIFLLISGLV